MPDAETDAKSEQFASRRSLVRGALLTVGAIGVAGIVPGQGVGAQDATPTEEGDGVSLLFVQSGFTSGSLDKATDGVRSWRLQFEGAPDHTLYFSDRPDRIVSAMPTSQFVGEFDFSEANPPNAALVMQHEDRSEIVFLTLTAPEYDATTGRLAYISTLLDTSGLPESSFEVSGELHSITADFMEFGSSSLFIDSKNNGLIGPGQKG